MTSPYRVVSQFSCPHEIVPIVHWQGLREVEKHFVKGDHTGPHQLAGHQSIIGAKRTEMREKKEKTSVTCWCRRNPCACLFSCDTLAFVYETLWTPFTFNPCYYLISEMNDGILLLNYGLCGSDACVLRSLVVSDHVRIRFPVEVTLEDVRHGRNMSEIVKQYNTIVCNSYDYNNTIRKEYLLAYYT